MAKKIYKYYAFISYQRKDEKIAKWLHKQLEQYRFPVNLLKRKKNVPEYLRPLFLDEAELSGGSLSKVIRKALVDSKYLIVLCSPNSAKSPWVNKEVQTFIDLGRTKRIIPLIIKGIPYTEKPNTECFTPAMASLRKTEDEPLGISIKAGREIMIIKLISCMLGVSFDQLWQRHEKEKEEERLRLIEEKRRLQRLESLYLSEKAEDVLEKGDSYLANMLALRALPADLTDPEERPYIPEAESILRKASLSRSAVLASHTRAVNSISLSPNGKHLLSGSADGTVKVWDLDCGKPVTTLAVHDGTVNSACYNHNGTCILTASSDGTIKITNVGSAQTVLCMNNRLKASCAVYSPCGKYIACGSEDGSISLWDAESGNLLDEFIGHGKWVGTVRFSKCGSLLLTASLDGTAMLWDVESVSCINVFQGHNGCVNSAEFSNDGKYALSASDDMTIKVWDIGTGEVVQTLQGHSSVVYSAVYSRDEKYILSASFDKTIKLWDAGTGTLLRTFKGHSLLALSAIFSFDGSYIISSSEDTTIRLWDYRFNREEPLIKGSLVGHELSTEYVIGLTCVKFCNNGKSILTSSNDHTIKLWDAETCTQTMNYTEHSDKVLCLAISPDGKHFASASADKTLKLWDFEHTGSLVTFTGHYQQPHHITFTADGKYLVSASVDKTARVWEVRSGKEIALINAGSHIVDKVISNDKDKEIIAFAANRAIIWDLKKRTYKKVVKIPVEKIGSVCIMDYYNGQLILTSGTDTGDRQLMIWDIKQEKVVKTLPYKHNAPVHFAEFVEDGKQIVSTAWYGSFNITDVGSGKDIWAFKPANESIRHLDFSPDKRTLALAVGDIVQLYNYMPLQELINETRVRFSLRNFSQEEKERYRLE